MIYSGGHEYTEGFFTDPVPGDIERAQKIYLNSAFIPANLSFACAGPNVCICEGESVTLGCPNINEDEKYSWTPSDGLSCTDCPHPEASPSVTTTYTMMTENGCNASDSTHNPWAGALVSL